LLLSRILTAITIKVTVFWGDTLSLLSRYQYFGGHFLNFYPEDRQYIPAKSQHLPNKLQIKDTYSFPVLKKIGIVGGWSPIGSTRHCGHQWPIVPAPGDYDDGEIGGMIGRGNRSTRRKPA
jgi:hypothetical protein